MTEQASITCEKHGDVVWDGHIACSKCGAAYMRTHAPQRCANCGTRLKKHPTRRDVPFSGIPCCPACFAAGQDVKPNRDDHGRDDPSCKGEACPFHGPQLRKLARRAARLAS